jgi:hypothetical protein
VEILGSIMLWPCIQSVCWSCCYVGPVCIESECVSSRVEWLARCRDLYLATHNTHNRHTSIPPVGFEPTISAAERRAATGTGHLWDNVNKYVRAKQATNDNIIRPMRVAYRVTKTHTHSEYVILLFHGNNGYANAPQCCVIRTLPLVLYISHVWWRSITAETHLMDGD